MPLSRNVARIGNKCPPLIENKYLTFCSPRTRPTKVPPSTTAICVSCKLEARGGQARPCFLLQVKGGELARNSTAAQCTRVPAGQQEKGCWGSQCCCRNGTEFVIRFKVAHTGDHELEIRYSS